MCIYNTMAEYGWNEAKRRENREKHGVDFASIVQFSWDTAIVERSDRYGEMRYAGVGYIGGRLHYVVFTDRGEATRIISLRRANAAERRGYAQTDV